MLGDEVRLNAYDQAIHRAVTPGDLVIDVGAGTLILSLLALRYGARHVYAIEADPQMTAVARRIAERNNLMGRLTLIQGDARTVQLPEKADVIVSEMMGNLGPEEEMVEIVRVTARRNLRPGGRVVPEQLTTRLQAIEFGGEGWGVWQELFWGFDLAAVQEYAMPGAQLHFFTREPKRLTGPLTVAENRLGETTRDPCGAHMLDITTHGRLHAVIGYFTATLADGVTLSNFPSYPGRNWAVWLWRASRTRTKSSSTWRGLT